MFHFRDDAILGLPVSREEFISDVKGYGWLIRRRPIPEKALSVQLGPCCGVDIKFSWWCGVEVDTRDFDSKSGAGLNGICAMLNDEACSKNVDESS
jgi:hypothetical protein